MCVYENRYYKNYQILVNFIDQYWSTLSIFFLIVVRLFPTWSKSSIKITESQYNLFDGLPTHR